MKHLLQFEMGEGKEAWRGTLEIKVPLNHERLAVLAKHDVHKLRGTGGAKGAKAVEAIFESQIPILSGVYGAMRHLIEKVDLTGPGGERVTSLEAFDTHPELGMGFMIVAAQYCEGFGPGKAKSQS